LFGAVNDAMLRNSMKPMARASRAGPILAALAVVFTLSSCKSVGGAQPSKPPLVKLIPFELDPKSPGRKQFGALMFMAAYQLESSDPRFGGLSGLTFGADGKLYAVSDRGYWLSARLVSRPDGALSDLADWRIAPILNPAGTAVSGALADAEALTRAPDGSLLVAFEGRHRIWRFAPPPATFDSTPVPIPLPAEMARAPSNGGLEGLAILPSGELLALTEEFANGDGSFKGWLIDNGRFAEIAYVPAKGFRVTDCAALANGDLLVLERRYVPFGIWSARLALVKGKNIEAGGRLTGQELVRLEQPLVTENYEGLAVQETPLGTMIYLVSDDNYSVFQQTLLLQFLLPN
jgi:hypothetical protein